MTYPSFYGSDAVVIEVRDPATDRLIRVIYPGDKAEVKGYAKFVAKALLYVGACDKKYVCRLAIVDLLQNKTIATSTPFPIDPSNETDEEEVPFVLPEGNYKLEVRLEVFVKTGWFTGKWIVVDKVDDFYISTVKPTEPTKPTILNIWSDKKIYKVGETAYVVVCYEGVGGSKQVVKDIVLYLDGEEYDRKTVVFYPDVKDYIGFTVKLNSEGRHTICADIS